MYIKYTNMSALSLAIGRFVFALITFLKLFCGYDFVTLYFLAIMSEIFSVLLTNHFLRIFAEGLPYARHVNISYESIDNES